VTPGCPQHQASSAGALAKQGCAQACAGSAAQSQALTIAAGLTGGRAAQVETRINCPLSAMQTFWYRRLLLKDSKMLKSLEAEFSNDPTVQVRCPCQLPVNTAPASLAEAIGACLRALLLRV